MHPVLRELRGDKALTLAFGISAMAGAILRDGDPSEPVGSWPMMTNDETKAVDGAIAARDVLAPFVRANPEAPPEALYIHASDKKIHTLDPHGWPTLALPAQFSYGLFALALLHTDKVIAAAKAAPAPAPQPALTRENYTHADETAGPGDTIDRPAGAPTQSQPSAKIGGTGEVKPKEPDPKRGAHARANKENKKKQAKKKSRR